jgi:hypothetical protein
MNRSMEGRGGALRGMDVKRWLYIEPYFRVFMVWPRSGALHELKGKVLRDYRDMENIAKLCRDSDEVTMVIDVRLTTEMLEACPRSLDYWLDDFNRATELVARQSAGGTSAVTFHRETLATEPPFVMVGVTTGKGRAAPTIPAQHGFTMPSRKATAPVPKPRGEAAAPKRKRRKPSAD